MRIEYGNREVSMSEYTIRDRVAIIGVGETKYYKRGQAPVPEFRLACEAIINAAEDAGIDVRDIDGVSGYADDRNDASRLATALGFKHLGFAGMMVLRSPRVDAPRSRIILPSGDQGSSR